jgi:hypothetical protein
MSRRVALLTLLLGIALPSAAARAADAVVATQPLPADVLRRMSDYLAEAKAYTYHAEIEFDQFLPGGPKIRLSGAVDVAVVRPGSLAIDYRDDVSARLIWYENGLLTTFDPHGETWAQVSGPKDIDGMVAKLEKDYGIALPLGELAESDPSAVLTRGIDMAWYVGVRDVEGIACQHVVLQRPDLNLQVFVEIGDAPVPRKLVFERPNQPGSPQYTAFLTEWSFEVPAKEIFSPKVPESAGRVDFLPATEAR